MRFRNPLRKPRLEPPDPVKLSASVVKPFSTTPREATPPAARPGFQQAPRPAAQAGGKILTRHARAGAH